MKKTLKITSVRQPTLMGRKLTEGEIVELDSDTAEFFIKNNLGVEYKSAKPKKRARTEKGHYKRDDPSTPEESIGRRKFNYLLGLAGRGERGIGEKTKKEDFDTFVDISKLKDYQPWDVTFARLELLNNNYD